MDPLWALWGYAVIIKLFGSSTVTEGVFSQFPVLAFKRRRRIQFGVLIGPNIVPLWSKKFGKNIDAALVMEKEHF